MMWCSRCEAQLQLQQQQAQQAPLLGVLLPMACAALLLQVAVAQAGLLQTWSQETQAPRVQESPDGC